MLLKLKKKVYKLFRQRDLDETWRFFWNIANVKRYRHDKNVIKVQVTTRAVSQLHLQYNKNKIEKDVQYFFLPLRCAISYPSIPNIFHVRNVDGECLYVFTNKTLGARIYFFFPLSLTCHTLCFMWPIPSNVSVLFTLYVVVMTRFIL